MAERSALKSSARRGLFNRTGSEGRERPGSGWVFRVSVGPAGPPRGGGSCGIATPSRAGGPGRARRQPPVPSPAGPGTGPVRCRLPLLPQPPNHPRPGLGLGTPAAAEAGVAQIPQCPLVIPGMLLGAGEAPGASPGAAAAPTRPRSRASRAGEQQDCYK